jgi:hypothetical protein
VALRAKNQTHGSQAARWRLLQGWRAVYGIVRNTTGEEWQLYAIDVKTGAEKMLAPLELPGSTDGVAGFSLHPDGNRFLTSIAKWPHDIWMLEGFDQMPRRRGWAVRNLDSTPRAVTW